MKKFYFLLIAMVISVFSASAIDYYLIGGFNNWSTMDANCKFTNQGDGTYTLNYQGTLTSGFKINDGTWSNANANFGGTATLVPGTTYNLVSNGGNIPIDKDIVNPSIVFNPTAKTLLISGQQEETVIAYAISGNIFTGSWTDVVMTESDGKWILPARSYISGDFGIKKINAKTLSQLEWISANGTTTVTINKAMSCKVEGSDFSLSTAGEYTLTFDPEAMTVLFAGEGGDNPDPIEPDDPSVDYSSWYVNIPGDFNSWKDNGIQPTKEGLSKHTDLPIGTSLFRVKLWNSVDGDISLSNGEAIAQGEWVSVPGDIPTNMTIAGAKEGELFDVEFNCADRTIKVTSKGGGEEPIEPIEPTTAKFGIVGSMQEPTNWNISSMLEMTEEADGTFSYHFDSLDKDAAFKIGTIGGTWDDTFGAESNDPSVTKIPVTVGEAMNAWKGSSNDFIISEALTDVTITFTYVEAGPSRITVTAKSEEPVEPIEPTTVKFGIVGSIQEPTIWDIDNMLEMTEAEGVYTYTFDELAEGTMFKIGTIGKGWDDTFGAENPDTSATEAADIPVTVGEAMNAWKGSSNNFLISEALTDVTITFAYVEAGPSLITVTGTVESPDPIEPDDPEPVEPDNFTATFNAIEEAENTPESDFTADGNTGNTYLSIKDKTFTNDNVSLTIGGSSTGARIYKTSSDIIDYRLYKGDIITIDAPAGYTITQVDVMSEQTKSKSKITNLEADGWTATEMTTLPEGMSCGYSFTPAARTATSQLVIKATHTSSAMRLTQFDVTVTKMTTGVEEVISVVNDAPVEYYNLNGVRVSEPSNGIYIRRQGNEVTKVIIK